MKYNGSFQAYSALESETQIVSSYIPQLRLQHHREVSTVGANCSSERLSVNCPSSHSRLVMKMKLEQKSSSSQYSHFLLVWTSCGKNRTFQLNTCPPIIKKLHFPFSLTVSDMTCSGQRNKSRTDLWVLQEDGLKGGNPGRRSLFPCLPSFFLLCGYNLRKVMAAASAAILNHEAIMRLDHLLESSTES